MDEGTLIRRASAGDRQAFGVLVRSHQEPIYRWIFRRVRDEETARDLTQETFLRGLRGLAGFRGDAAFGTWLRTIATNVVRSHARREAGAATQPLDPELPSGDPGPDAALLQDRVRNELAEAVERLPPRQREVVMLRIHEDLSYADIARATGGTENAAKVNFHHAIKRLRILLNASRTQRVP
ncbi:MAG: sigma-70 family RNA polymerase sigma factor [Gemmatimonadetes bacterium]|nr:sigma-70 family RNA polymerase sigma factor [Gemmatimonadota bacterium]